MLDLQRRNFYFNPNWPLLQLFLKYLTQYHQKLGNTRAGNIFLFLTQVYGVYGITYFLRVHLSNYVYSRLKRTKLVQSIIQSKTEPVIQEIRDELNKEVEILLPRPNLIERGMNESQIIQEFEKMKNLHSFDFKQGQVSGAVYSNTPELDKLIPQIYSYFSKSNPLHTNVFPAVRKMENDLVKMMINFFKGDEDVVGCFTSGGTESILLACKTYRDRASLQGITKPNMIVSSTAHCAFHKAAKYFQIELVTIPCVEDGKFDLLKLKDTINHNTILVVGSAPSYNLGIVDPIQEMADICLSQEVGFHVDCCMGAFLINFSQEKYSFEVPGVTSISADYHKYGQSPKGASVVMYENRNLMKHQYYIYENWSGGVYATSTMLGSKNGNVVALTWATVMYLGLKSYRDKYSEIINNAIYLQEQIKTIPELFIYGEPQLNIIAIGSHLININILGETLKKQGWSINMIQNPSGFHFCVTEYHTTEVLDRFMECVRDLIPTIPDSKTKSKCIYGTMKSVGDGDIVKDIVAEYLHITNGF